MKKQNKKPVDIIEKNFGKALGADEVVYREKITIFIAHKDRHGNKIPKKIINKWIKKAEIILSAVGGGATSIKVRGAWSDHGAPPIHEDTTLVYSYAKPKAIIKYVKRIKKFLFKYGKSTDQGEVALLLENQDGDWFYRIPKEKYQEKVD